MPPWHGGGEMIVSVSYEKSTFKPAPARFEAGTPNIAGAIGLAAACDYLDAIGREKIFEVRKLYCDLTFIDTFLTEEFCQRHKLFSFAFDGKKSAWTIQSRDFVRIKEALLFQLTNFGAPHITANEANYQNRGELVLTHSHEGVDLREDYARETLANLQRIWKRPVHIETKEEDKGRLLSFDGTEASMKEIAAS